MRAWSTSSSHIWRTLVRTEVFPNGHKSPALSTPVGAFSIVSRAFLEESLAFCPSCKAGYITLAGQFWGFRSKPLLWKVKVSGWHDITICCIKNQVMDYCVNIIFLFILYPTVPSTVKQISGGKTKKDRVTIGLCAIITGSHKLSPLFIHKFKNPRALKPSNDLPIIYKAQRNAWVDRTIFKNWLENSFKPAVKKEQLRTNRVGKIVLLVDNCNSHVLPAESLDSEDFQLVYLLANNTSIL